ncbi:Hypothetical predicted protein [Paramuricea clavata]|uniref:Uncharacterized protein n=1 Tax=Paramuricea clavata TaxID=317549 RepID=A0A6S7IBM2_PARCT|nr:Hypothetical predicted protein [Paramuricea clavata]
MHLTSNTNVEYGQATTDDRIINVGMRPALVKAKMNDRELTWQPETGATEDIMDKRNLRENEKELGLVQYNEKFLVQQIDEKRDLAEVSQKVRPNVREILEKLSEVSSPNIGKAVGRQMTIMADETVAPVVQNPRRVPYNLAAKAEEKIPYLLNQDIIEKVPDDETRTWVSPTVIAPKPSSDQIRLCVDMRMANNVILRPYTQLPTMEDVINKFQGAKKFSKLDCYHRITQNHDLLRTRWIVSF